jgi:hypothetical protein
MAQEHIVATIESAHWTKLRRTELANLGDDTTTASVSIDRSYSAGIGAP